MQIQLVKYAASLSGNITKQINSAFVLIVESFPMFFGCWALAVGKCTALSLAAAGPSHLEHPATWQPRERAETWEQGADFFSLVKKKMRNSSVGWKAEVGASAWQHCSENQTEGLNSLLYGFLRPLGLFFFSALSDFYGTRILPMVCDTKAGSPTRGFAWRQKEEGGQCSSILCLRMCSL